MGWRPGAGRRDRLKHDWESAGRSGRLPVPRHLQPKAHTVANLAFARQPPGKTHAFRPVAGPGGGFFPAGA